ncbi:hypothetical protein K2173_020559 [Erythroxylum novogranatense]|uniref:Uncharacterized protein n=1 Tax=Erythroxylum novogranatense TaxID=1862640 RepID=A0AAV8TIH9_9ROSI|nr:hypothetical protein K2173_020559 [Erythroxylum novogranatense]
MSITYTSLSGLTIHVEEVHISFYPSRQQLTLLVPPGSTERSVVLSYKKSLKDYLTIIQTTIVFKDLGPLVLYPVFYHFPMYKYFGYKEERVIHPVQTYALSYWCFHYFNHATSPLSNVFRNCAYYWTFSSYIAYFVNHPLYKRVGDLQMKIVSNFYCHLILKNLRSLDRNGGRANYTTEIYQWLGFNIATQAVTGYIFLMLFDGKDGRPEYPRRWVILPPFL